MKIVPHAIPYQDFRCGNWGGGVPLLIYGWAVRSPDAIFRSLATLDAEW